MKYTKDIFSSKVDAMQKVRQEIFQLNQSITSSTWDIEKAQLLEKKNRSFFIDTLENVKRQLKIRQEEYNSIAHAIANNTDLVQIIDLNEDPLIQKGIRKDPQLATGIEQITLYGSIEYNKIFDGPPDLRTSGACSLVEFEKYAHTVSTTNIQKRYSRR